MISRYLILILFLQPLFRVTAQNDCCSKRLDQQLLFEARLTGEAYQMKRIMGSQLFRDRWFKGNIILISGDVVRSKELAYNGYLDELIWNNPDRIGLTKIDRQQIQKFMLFDNKDTLIFGHLLGTYKNRSGLLDIFARELRVGSLSLYAAHRIITDEKIEQDVKGVVINIEKVMNAPILYYIGLPDHAYLTLNKINRKSVYALFPEYRKEIRTLLIGHHLKLKTEHHLQQFIDVLETSPVINISETKSKI